MLGWAFRSWLNRISLKNIHSLQLSRMYKKTILPQALVWKPFRAWKKKRKRTANSLLFYLHILFDNKIRVVIEQQVLTVVWPQEWFRQHMFPKELLGEGPGSVYLFLMKPAVALMADILNRSPSHTEENNKQQASSFCWTSLSLVSSLSHAHKSLSQRSIKPIHNTLPFLSSMCLYL